MDYIKIAERYFQKLKELEEETKEQRLELEALRYRASGAGAIRYDKEKVMTSAENHMEDAVADIIRVEKMHEATIKTYEDKKAEAYNIIKQIPNINQRTVLIWIYIQNETIRSTAKKMFKAERSIYTLRKEAFNSFGMLMEKMQIYS